MEEFTESGARLVDEEVPGPLRDLIGYGPDPPDVRWPGGARVALSFIVNYEEGSERSKPAGDDRNESFGELPHGIPPEYRDLRVESVYEYGSRAGIWRLLRLFGAYDIPLTFHAAAVALERNPEVARFIRREGHEACAHGWRWSEQWVLDREEELRRISYAVRSIEETCGQRPRGWYSRYGPSVHTRELLVEHGGFRYDSDAYNDDLPYFVEVNGTRHLVLPYTLIYNDIRFVLAPGYTQPDDFFQTCRDGFDYLWDEGAQHPRVMCIGLHPRWAGQPARTAALRRFVDHVLSKGEVWIARRVDIAEYWWEHYG